MASDLAVRLRDEYLIRVNDLYDFVDRVVRGADSQATIDRDSTITLREEPIEQYEAPVFIVSRPSYRPVRFIPRGRWVLGAEGRVDMVSDLDSVMLVYLSEEGMRLNVTIIVDKGGEIPYASHPIAEPETPGWVYADDPRLRKFPSLTPDLLLRILEVLGR